MFTTREAARLLSDTEPGADPLATLAGSLGFGPPQKVGRTMRARFGLTTGTSRVRVAAAAGSLRLLLVDFLVITEGSPPLRDAAASAARSLSREAPDNLWLLLARDPDAHAIIIAAPPPGGVGPISALVVDQLHVLNSDAETCAALAACDGGSDLLMHLRWRETLGRDALTRRFYRDLERCVHSLASSAIGAAEPRDRRTMAVLCVSRLLFLAFLEAKGWLDRDRSFLRRHFEEACGGRGVQRRFLEPLFFGTLNTAVSNRATAARAFGRVPFLNGGLFTRTPLEKRHRTLRFTDEALGEIIGGLLARYRLTARETSADWSDAAVDPEMLGRAFESLMAADDRRASGAFYTPHALIVRLARQALDSALGAVVVPADETASVAMDTLARLDGFRLIDPACGSGAFLVFALEELAERRATAGDSRGLGARRRHVLTHSIFGVDLDPTAVWLCQLRLWLSVVVEDETDDTARLLPLPNLDRNVREGDALAGDGFAPHPVVTAQSRSLQPLRLRYSRASGARKRTLSRALDRAERALSVAAVDARLTQIGAERLEMLSAARGRDLFSERRGPDAASVRALDALRLEARTLRASLRKVRDGGALPFSFATHFPDAAQHGGFALVIGNPPWVRPHAMAAAAGRDALRERFFVYRCAAWRDGAEAAAAGRGFASQADLSAIFTERAVQLAAPGGVIALLLPSKLWIALAGGGVREYLARHAPPVAIDDWTGGSAGFDAAVYPSALLARRAGTAIAIPGDVLITAHSAVGSEVWRVPRTSLAIDESPGAPWLLLPTPVRSAFMKLDAAGVPLASSVFGRPMLGVKTGCNEAFVVERIEARDSVTRARVRSGTTEDWVESGSLRPLIRGEHLSAWRHESAGSAIIWTHDQLGAPTAVLATDTRRWLLHWRRRLEQRSDGRGGRWWSLFRTEAARSDRPRVVWGDIGRAPRAVVLDAGDATVPLNSCYVVRAPTADDAHALAALLNSAVICAWLSALAEPARGGYRRFLGWTCARLPIPRRWEEARALLAPLGRAGAAGEVPSASALNDAVLGAFALEPTEVEALIAWNRRAP